MARAMRDARHQARRLGLLTAAVAACAVMEQPPGGPPDFAAPVLAAVTPDSGAVVPDLDRPMRFQFDEVISERSGGGLDQLVRFSPRVEQLTVSWKRNAIEVRPKRGWRPGVVYQVVLLPGVMDLQNNRTEEGRTIVFSTGDSLPDTRLAGIVLNWEDGVVARNALVEAALLPDTLVYVASTDSIGEFLLTSLPTGQYWVTAAIDGNNSGRRDPREPFDSVTVTLDSTASTVFWSFARDTLGPQIRQLEAIDSVTVRIEFTQRLSPGNADSSAVRVFALPDTLPVSVRTVRSAATQDSLSAAVRRAAADSAAVADSLRAAADTGAAALDTAQAGPPRRAIPPRPPVAQDTLTTPADSSAAERLLAQRPVLSSTWYVVVAQPLEPGARYLIQAVTRNVSGVEAESLLPLLVPALPDST